MSESTSDFDYIMKSPEGLLNVRIEASIIREVLLEMHSKIEDLNKKMIDFLKSREINQLQDQIDQINSKIDALEQQGVETPAAPAETNSFLSESLERKIEESKFLLDKSLRNFMKKSIDELKASCDQSLTDLKDDMNVSNSMKYSTIQMFSDLQQHIEDIDSKFQTLNSKVRKVPTSEKLSSRTSSSKNSDQNINSNAPSNLDPSPPDSASQNSRISKMSIKLSTLESAFDTMRNIVDEMKKRLKETEKNCNDNSESIKVIEEKLQRIPKSMQTSYFNNNNINESKSNESTTKYTQPETIIKTVPQQIDMDSLKFEVVQSVLDQVIPFINEYIEKVDDIQNNVSNQKVDDEKKSNNLTVPNQQDTKESQEEAQTNKEPQKDESNKPSQNSNTPSQNRPHRDFSSLLSGRSSSPRATKPSISDPRVTACEMQIKALKNTVTALENALKSQFGLLDSRMTDLLLRTTSIEKCIEDSGTKIERVKTGLPDDRQNVDSIGCQTVEDDVGVMVDLNEIESKNEKESSPHQVVTSPKKEEEEERETPTTTTTPVEPEKNNTQKVVKIDNTTEKVDSKEVDNNVDNLRSPKQTIVKPVISQRPSSSTASNRQTVISPIKKDELHLVINTPHSINGSSRGAVSSRSNLSSRSHITSQTYEELDSLTRSLQQQISELAIQVQNATDRLGDEDRQIHQLSKSISSIVSRKDLDDLRAELEERNAFNRKNNPNSESVTALQLKRVVTNFQNQLKSIDKQVENVTEKVPLFVTKQELTELVEAVTQLAVTQDKERASSTAGGAMGYKCLLCGRPTSQVTGMITESEVAKMIGEPPIIGATAARATSDAADGGFGGVPHGGGADLVLMYGREGTGTHRAASQMTSKRKKMTVLPKILPKSPNLQPINGNNGNVNASNT